MENKTETDKELKISLSPSEVFDAGRAAEKEGFSSLPAFVRAAMLEKAKQVNNASVRGKACTHD